MKTDLDRLEEEVEASRSRVRENLSALRSESMYAGFVNSLKETAIDTKNTVVEDVKDRSRSAVQDVVDAAKAKAAANPAATLVIGLGVAWHLVRNPPITAALVGAGLFSLLRTKASATPRDTSEHLSIARENLSAQAGDFAEAAVDAAQRGATFVADRAASLSQDATDSVAAVASRAGDAVRQGADYVADRASTLSEGLSNTAGSAVAQVSDLVDSRLGSDGKTDPAPSEWQVNRRQAAVPQFRTASNGQLASAQWSRDRLLLGAAGLAVGTALAISLRRQQQPAARKAPSRARRSGKG